MSRIVTISERAEKNLDEILAYLDSEWPPSVKVKFLQLLENKIKHIAERPLMYQASIKRRSIRRCFVGKPVVMYYQVRKNEVEIITIQSTRKKRKD